MKKGVSPLISVILLLVIVVSMAGSVFMFVRGLSTKISGEISRNIESADNYKIRFLPVSYCKWYNDYYNRTVDIILYFKNEGRKIKNNTLITLAIRDIDGNNLYTIIDKPLLKYDCERDKVCFISLLGLDLVKREPYEIYLTIGKSDFHYKIEECRRDKSLVLYLKFDEGSGDKAYDYSVYHTHGTLYDANSTNADGNTPPKWVDGILGKALEFDGVDDYVEVLDAQSNSPRDGLTVAFWLKSFNISRNAGLVWKGYNWVVYHPGDENPDKAIKGRIWNESVKALTVFVNDTFISENEFHFIVLTYTSTSGILRIYSDGILHDIVQNNTFGLLRDGDWNLHIGRRHDNVGDIFYQGIIDEVRIYNRALSEQEIKELYYGTR